MEEARKKNKAGHLLHSFLLSSLPDFLSLPFEAAMPRGDALCPL
jgi:hypothetical protein